MPSLFSSLRVLKLSQIFTIILLVALLYITFQIFILNRLNIYNNQVIKHEIASNVQEIRAATHVTEHDKNLLIVNKNVNLDSAEIEKHINIKHQLLNQTINQLFHFNVVKHNKIENNKQNNFDNNFENIKGVNKNNLKFYQPNEHDQFECLKSKVLIRSLDNV